MRLRHFIIVAAVLVGAYLVYKNRSSIMGAVKNVAS